MRHVELLKSGNYVTPYLACTLNGLLFWSSGHVLCKQLLCVFEYNILYCGSHVPS